MSMNIQANNNPIFFSALQNAMGQTQQFTGNNASQLANQMRQFAQMGTNSFATGGMTPNSFGFAAGAQWGNMGQSGFLNAPMGAAGGTAAGLAQTPNAMGNLFQGLNSMQDFMQGFMQGMMQSMGMPAGQQGMPGMPGQMPGMNGMPGMAQKPNCGPGMGKPQMAGMPGQMPGMPGQNPAMGGPQGQINPQQMQQMGQMLDGIMKAVGNMAQMLQKAICPGKGPQQPFPGAQPMAQQPKAGPCAGKFAGGGAVAGGAARGGARQVRRPGLQGIGGKPQAPQLEAKDQKVLDHMRKTDGKKWLVNHGQYKKCKDGSFEITKGELAGYKAVPGGGKGQFNIVNPKGQNVGEWKAPKGANKVASPIALDLNGDGQIGVTGNSTSKFKENTEEVGRTVAFDLNNDGVKEQVEWLKGDGDAMLVDNRDGNAANDMNGGRLFGDEGGKYANGYEKLKRHDANGDGQLTGEELDGLSVWRDNGDAVVQEGEMISAREAGVERMSVDMRMENNAKGEGLMRSDAQINGRNVMTEDVWFTEKKG